jgi:N-acetylneuraminic acid mutarotase
MKKIPVLLLPVLCAVLLFAAQPKFPTMPVAVSGNAVASLKGGLELYSLMGIGNKKTWDDITSRVYSFHLSGAKWMEVRPVPGVAGRLGASAIGVRGQIFVFGGYVVDGHGVEMTVADVNSYVADEHRWYRAADMPVPVDSAVIGEDRERYIYLVGGRSKNGPVNNVQVYDAVKNTWSQATPFPGTPVFGLAGGVADEAIIYVDGAEKNSGAGAPYVASDECWIGRIDKKDPNKIEWSKLPPHPGTARFGIVAGARNGKVLFSGGSASVHNYKGLDAEGKPVDISTVTFCFDVRSNKWETIDEETYDARTDSRGILSTPVGPVILGGIVSNQAPTARVLLLGRK